MKQFRDTMYKVHKDGYVINIKSGRQLKSRLSSRGYHRVNLMIDGLLATFRLHRVVAEVYLPNPLNLPQVDHIDGNKNNNAVSNLRWCTNKENLDFYYTANPDKKAKPIVRVYGTKQDMVSAVAKDIRVNGVIYESVTKAAKHIADNEGKQLDTVRKELRNYIQGKRPEWCMYGKYNIGF